jgi:hypothetical protein
MQHEAYSIILYLWLQENTKYCISSTYHIDFDSLIRSCINDTMKDRLVNFLDAVIFSIVLLRQVARTGQIRRKDHTEGIDAG